MQAEEAFRLWRQLLRNPYHRLWDPRYEGCDHWQCCPDLNQVQEILEIVAHHLPQRDARRYRRLLESINDDW